MKTVAVVLAAGNGTRFGKSEVNKTAIKIANIPMVQMGIQNISSLVEKIVVVVGYKKESVINSVASEKVIYATQARILGTGHAVKIAVNKLASLNETPEDILVSNADHLFMIDKQAIADLLQRHGKESNDVTILTAIHENPYPLSNGRIVRNAGQIKSILEKSNFTNETRLIREVNTGTYVFRYKPLREVLLKAKTVNNHELYITKVLFDLQKIGSLTVPFSKVGTGVNTREELKDFLDQINSRAIL